MKFYSVEWIKEILKEYKEETSFFIEDKEVVFSPDHFKYALLHLFRKNLLSLEELSKITNLPSEEINSKRSDFAFMYLVDLLRKEFAFWLKDFILGRELSLEEYKFLAQEFHFLEEQLRKQIQIPLLDRLKKLILDIEEAIEEQKKVEEKTKRNFKKLTLFFSAVEAIQRSKSERLVNRAKNLYTKLFTYQDLTNFNQLPDKNEVLLNLKKNLSELK